MALGGFYDEGTVTIADGTTAVVGTGTAWSLEQIERGDDFVISGAGTYPIASVEDDTHLTLQIPMVGTFTDHGDYVIKKTSWSRYDPALTQSKLRTLLTSVQMTSVMYGTGTAAPSNSFGEDGQFAFQVTELGLWVLWLKVDGEWQSLGSPAGVRPRGAWSSITAYLPNDIVTTAGKTYYALQPSTNKSPASEPTYWGVFLTGGDRYDLASFDTDRPASGELIVKIYPKDVTFYAGLLDSQSGAEVAATAESVFSLTKNGTQFATITFSAASATGVFACATDTAFADGDVLRIYAPSPRDATLAGVASSIVGYR